MNSPKADAAPSASIRYIKGIGPKRALALEKMGIRSERDLFFLFPRRHEDRSKFGKISGIQPGDTKTFLGEVLSVQLKRFRRISMLDVTFGDDTATIHAVWFNQHYLKNYFEPGRKFIIYGRADWKQNRIQISGPDYEQYDSDDEFAPVHMGRIVPIYPLSQGLFQKSLRQVMHELVETRLDQVISEYLPQEFREEHGLPGIHEAIRQMHFPESLEKLAPARRRIVFDEFLLLQLTLLNKLQKMRLKYSAHAVPDNGALASFLKRLPFALTPGQDKALNEIASDIARPHPMNRLLQGDVGSGKTVIAAAAMYLAAQNKKQSALLVPTEILAEQHYRSLLPVFDALALKAALLTAGTPAPKRERLVAELKQGKIDVLIGTHAILQEDVKFHTLALVVIDEQHKFGVHQRGKLLESNPRPHQLVMTATPIPRTLALTVYGDLDISTIRELPAGRLPIRTHWVTRRKQAEVFRRILARIQKGEQAYFIFPLVEETEKSDLLAAEQEYKRLKEGPFAGVKMGLVHGRMSSEEKETVMKGFVRNEIKILVATSVIEVGVNNPNATVMVIENSERFGLSQLHQMRGRIGRGHLASECFLFGEPKTPEGKKRLEIMVEHRDGFLIAEEDLKLRGPGDFWGTRQSGEPLFRVAHPVTDAGILQEARAAAAILLKTRALETDSEWACLKNFLAQFPIRY